MSARPRPRAPASPARRVATTVLHRVATDGAYAAKALDAELTRGQLSERDARLAAEIVYGSLRVLPELDAALERHLPRGRPEPYTWAALRAAAYQARHLGRVPAHAIVQDTVSIVRRKRGEGLSKLTNAVLRKLLVERPADPEPPKTLVVPDWVRTSLADALGEARARSVLEAEQGAVPLGVRAVKLDAEVLASRLREALPRASVEASSMVQGALRVRGGGDPRSWPGYAEGAFAVQDEGAQAIVPLLQARPGERVWDACAGRGGKTLQLAQAVGPEGRVVASDLYPEKLEQLEQEAQRLGLVERVECVAVNLEVGAGAVQGLFDRVLVDAPCTGLGTIRRRPEILLRLRPSDPARLAQLQRRIVAQVMPRLRPGGRLALATCSPTREEGYGIAEAVERDFPHLRRVTDPSSLGGVHPDPDGIVRFGPFQADGGGPPDVYQITCWDCP